MVQLSEDEMINFAKVWAAVFASLSYCYIIGKVTPKGIPRLTAISPIICLFLALPLHLTSVHFTGLTSFFISWLANFKLLLFAFDKGPLSSDPNISFLLFLAVSCLPIKIQRTKNNPSPKSQNKQDPDQKSQNKSHPSQKTPKNPTKSIWNYIVKGSLVGLMLYIYTYSDYMNPKILWLIYCFHIYFVLEIILAIVATTVKIFLGLELEPQFNEPLLSTSLQDFWGRRWNVMVTSILRPTVYEPVLRMGVRAVGHYWAPLPAVFSTFVVSAGMHELIFYYLGRVKPTLEITGFFLLHGVCLCGEIAMKKAVPNTWRKLVPRAASRAVTVVFVIVTGLWLFLPPLLRAKAEQRAIDEYAAVAALARRVSTVFTLLNNSLDLI